MFKVEGIYPIIIVVGRGGAAVGGVEGRLDGGEEFGRFARVHVVGLAVEGEQRPAHDAGLRGGQAHGGHGEDGGEGEEDLHVGSAEKAGLMIL